jgi:hypothetical protein
MGKGQSEAGQESSVTSGAFRTKKKRAGVFTRFLFALLVDLAGSTVVLVKGFLSQAVGCEGGHGALKARRGQTPLAARAAPAAESIAVRPNKASFHASTRS